MSYGVILADPPWRYRVWSGNHGRRTAESFYPTMSCEELCTLRTHIDRWAAKDCALFLWVTAPVLLDAPKVIKAWGFTYKTVAFTWVKMNKNGKPFTGMGYYTRANAEFCLLATRGKPRVKVHGINQVILAPRREHFRKPDEQYPRIMQLFEGPYLELFARARWPGRCGGWKRRARQCLTRYRSRALQIIRPPALSAVALSLPGAGLRHVVRSADRVLTGCARY